MWGRDGWKHLPLISWVTRQPENTTWAPEENHMSGVLTFVNVWVGQFFGWYKNLSPHKYFLFVSWKRPSFNPCPKVTIKIMTFQMLRLAHWGRSTHTYLLDTILLKSTGGTTQWDHKYFSSLQSACKLVSRDLHSFYHPFFRICRVCVSLVCIL